MEEQKVKGRPFTYTADEFKQKWEEYFKWCDENPLYKNDIIRSGDRAGEIIKIPTSRPYTEIGFCAYHDHGVHFITQLNTILSSKKPTDPEYVDCMALSSILNKARAKCTANKLEGGLAGIYNPGLIARDLGMVDKTAVAGDENGGAIKIIVTSKRGPVQMEDPNEKSTPNEIID